MNEQFSVRTGSFEGPLDLLLSLIEKRKLFINDISLSKVADDYIEYVKTLGNFPVGTTAHFILIASTLLLIKSRSLLPTLPLTEEEEGSIEDLETRLKIYKRFKELSIHTEKAFGKKIIFPRLPNKNITVVFSPEEGLTISNTLLAIQKVIQSFPKEELLPKAVVRKIMSLEDMIEKLTVRIQGSLKMSFGEFSKSERGEHEGARHKVTGDEKVNIIIGFLAMLELVKQGIIEVTQRTLTDDIQIEIESVGTPNYH